MSNLLAILETEADKRTPEQQAAIDAHERLLYDRQMVEVGLASMCRDLKEIRDKKHYKTLGYDKFADYTQEAHGIGQRQAYKYIQIYEHLGAEVLHSSAKIGVTKLLEIATLNKDEREELFAEHTADELAAMSTDEVKRLTEQVKKLEEQISFLESAPKEEIVTQQPFDEIEADIRAQVEAELKAEYEEKLVALEGKAISDEELKKYRANAEKEAKAAAAEEAKKLKADLKAAKEAQKAKEDALKKAEEARKAAEEKVKAVEEKAARTAELEAKIAAAEAEKAAVEKQIKLSADPEYTRFKFLFEAWQNSTSALTEQFGKLDADKQTKMKAAIKTVTEGMGL